MSQKLKRAKAQVDREDGRSSDLDELKRLAAELHRQGIDFAVEGGRVVLGGTAAIGAPEAIIPHAKERLRIGVVSDTHGGSKFEQLTALRAFYREADEAGVDFFVHAGDWTQGPDQMHRDQYLGLHAHGADAQVGYVATVYPKSERDVPTYALAGNHDASFLAEGGINVVRRITQERPDIIYLGADAAYLRVAGLLAYVTHPAGGGAYAKSYRPQKIAEALPLDPPVALLLIGHYHNWASTLERDTVAIQLPCFQAQYAWLARKALHPNIGGIVLDIALDDNGKPAEIAQRNVWYRPRDDDWDREVSFAMSHRWSDKGLG